MRASPDTLAEVACRARRTEIPFSVSLDEFLDAFYTQDDRGRRQAMIGGEPERIGVEREDAYLAAVAEHLARVDGLTIPGWTEAAWREVAEPWFVGRMGTALAPMLLVESPIAFRRRRLFTEADPLRRARRPAARVK